MQLITMKLQVNLTTGITLIKEVTSAEVTAFETWINGTNEASYQWSQTEHDTPHELTNDLKRVYYTITKKLTRNSIDNYSIEERVAVLKD
ncbi:MULTISPECIES: hypothetical protein [unclassified Bacillus cereus group]|uniref:hypothetical protein n=1 Tax=unclassified Bacillus cereus group TaxID=2750818 RepID=UPI000C330C78|nr:MULTISPECIES: hypothetical protein [unclassified Bacillus cereus group]MDA1588991.1 hypothetical protein [Bacillus cereus group sp. TH225LC]PKF96669.1 hypothetical protein CW365_27595 [Bacillus cereus]